MATRAEITDAIRAGVNRADSTFRQLSESQLDTRVHENTGGWTARQVLAHLAGRQETYDMLFKLAENPAGALEAGFSIDSWNQRLVEQRAGRDCNTLLEEFHDVHEELIRRVEETPDEKLQRKVVLPNGESTLGDVLLGSGGMHSIQHAEEVEKALDLPN